MGEASYILGIKIYRDRSRRMLGLTQSSYIEKVLNRFKMKNSKQGFLPMRHGIKLSKKQSLKTDEEFKRIYQACVGEAHKSAVKTILKYLKRTKDMFLIYGGGELILEGYSDASFQSYDDGAKSQLGFVFKLKWWCGCLEKFQAGVKSTELTCEGHHMEVLGLDRYDLSPRL
ncbi:UNVERIFIED_CONTAM: Retrovirus-related Pol polyprotein from transposon TNT 1-94 [Sesamum latifolium]|uniref:Retrovirus-related Pol polyprotein from transposon TNT 1-94 n=1 Tax=Sesamum latifolium TaxID=2727402 RepID=A0AAW2U768_9LAMI